MTFDPIKPGGFSEGERLTHDHVNAINTDLPNAIDGAAGGTYAPSAAISIGAAGLIVAETPLTSLHATSKVYVDSLASLRLRAQAAWFVVTGSAADGNPLTLTKSGEIGGSFSVDTNQAVVPAAATYLALLKAELSAADSTDDLFFGAQLDITGSGTIVGGRACDYRRSTVQADTISVSTLAVVTITNPTTDKIRVEAKHIVGTGNISSVSAIPDPGMLVLVRISP